MAAAAHQPEIFQCRGAGHDGSPPGLSLLCRDDRVVGKDEEPGVGNRLPDEGQRPLIVAVRQHAVHGARPGIAGKIAATDVQRDAVLARQGGGTGARRRRHGGDGIERGPDLSLVAGEIKRALEEAGDQCGVVDRGKGRIIVVMALGIDATAPAARAPDADTAEEFFGLGPQARSLPRLSGLMDRGADRQWPECIGAQALVAKTREVEGERAAEPSCQRDPRCRLEHLIAEPAVELGQDMGGGRTDHDSTRQCAHKRSQACHTEPCDVAKGFRRARSHSNGPSASGLIAHHGLPCLSIAANSPALLRMSCEATS